MAFSPQQLAALSQRLTLERLRKTPSPNARNELGLDNLLLQSARLLGEGGSAITALFTTADGELVAVKELKTFGAETLEAEIDLYRRERRNLALVLQRNGMQCHPNIACYRGADRGPRLFTRGGGDTAFIITDFVSEVTLDRWARQSFALPSLDRSQRFARLFATALRGLAFLHEQANQAHRDIKGDNIVVRRPTTAEPESVLIDLGLACVGDVPDDCVRYSGSGFPLIKHYYRFVLESQPQEIKRADVWALALTFVSLAGRVSYAALLTNDERERAFLSLATPGKSEFVQRVFSSQQRMAVLQANVQQALAASGLSPQLQRVLGDTMREWQRPPRASEVLAVLLAVQ